MKKLYIKPITGIGCLQFEGSLLITSKIDKGDDISGTSSTHVEADARGGFWDDTEK